MAVHLDKVKTVTEQLCTMEAILYETPAVGILVASMLVADFLPVAAFTRTMLEYEDTFKTVSEPSNRGSCSVYVNWQIYVRSLCRCGL